MSEEDIKDKVNKPLIDRKGKNNSSSISIICLETKKTVAIASTDAPNWKAWAIQAILAVQ